MASWERRKQKKYLSQTGRYHYYWTLDRMQVQMATEREFLLILRLGKQKEHETFSYLNRIEKMLIEQEFKAKRADEEDTCSLF